MAVTSPIDLASFKRFLNVSDSSLDTDLATVLSEAAELVETAVGPMTPVTVTERVRNVACDGSFVLQRWPVVSLLAVTALSDSSSVDITSADVDPATGVVTGVSLSRSARYSVTYSAGRANVPGPLEEATLVVGEQLWSARRGPVGAQRFSQAGVGDPTQSPVYKGFAWPNRATQLCAPYLQPWCG